MPDTPYRAPLAPYQVNLPYPEIKGMEPNRRFAVLLSDAYAGRGSEMTAVNQYLVHSYYLEEYPKIYQTYQKIAQVEQIHLQLLGKLIHNLGSRPLLQSYVTNHYWNGSFSNYEYSLGAILESDIRRELEEISHYKLLIRQINEDHIQHVIGRIILDEQRHVEILSAFLADSSTDVTIV